MRDQVSWSLSLGRWGGLQVRLHMLFLLFACCALYFAWLEGRYSDQRLMGLALFSVGVLLVSVLAHELGHFGMAVRLGGGANRLILGPHGGMSPMQVPTDPGSELLVHAAGPFVSLLACLFLLPVLLFSDPDLRWIELLHPLQPTMIFDGQIAWLHGLRLAFWINWLLLLLNLFPAFPLDGGRMLRAALMLLWPALDRRSAAVLVARFAKVLAVGLVLMAWLIRNDDSGRVLPTWFALVVLALLLYFSARSEQQKEEDLELDAELLVYEFPPGYEAQDDVERQTHPPAEQRPISTWFQRRRERRRMQRIQQEADEERRMDEILARVHEGGMQSLTVEERAILERVSARYRRRGGALRE